MLFWHASCYKDFTMFTNYKNIRYTYEPQDNQLTVKIELAGRSKDDVKIHTKDDHVVLNVDGKHDYIIDTTYVFNNYQKYNLKKTKASMKNGLLTLNIPNYDEKEGLRKIEIE